MLSLTEVFGCGTWEVILGLHIPVTTCQIHVTNMSQHL